MATKKTTASAAKAAAKKTPANKPATAKRAAAVKKPAATQAATKPKKPAGKKTAAAVVPAAVSAKRWNMEAFSRKLAGLRVTAAVAAVLLLAAAGLLLLLNNGSDNAAKPVSQEAYRQELQAQVEQPDGTPNTGRDPANQGQNSLEAAASKPAGAGLRSDQPASGATGNTGGQASHGDVYGDAKGSGIGSNGCFIDYGIQGEQCLPAHAAGDDKVLNCAEVRKYFKDGVAVTGTDRFHLDHDGDKIACGPGEVSH